ncbi:AEC family transporter [Bacillus sp. HMF5848]|uniref:AEC family transporter n=1 Tax=Bacillus sp. HMF5848 TaxID=2495421 RepID=UPI000F778EB0|nr:AEC family transporter [Bacillus sp. HMF5848]RSK26688.1 AEC family transporter [Bacillus sp. HMF5848]
MSIVFGVIMPVFLIFTVGFIVQKWKQMNIRSVSTIAVYILTPALVFRTFLEANLNKQYFFITIFALCILFSIIIINKLYARWRKLPQDVESGLILSTAFMNAGNYGSPIILFAYGETGFTFAVSFLVLQSIIMNFFGVYYAAKGHAGVKDAILAVLKMPVTYALLGALFFNIANVPFPENIFSAIDLLADAAIPVAMLILGMQLADLNIGKVFDFEKVVYGVTTRMVISPLLAYVFVTIMPFEPLLQKVLIVLTAMPTAVTTTMYALHFNTRPQLVSSITLCTTVLSAITITLLLMFL